MYTELMVFRFFQLSLKIVPQTPPDPKADVFQVVFCMCRLLLVAAFRHPEASALASWLGRPYWIQRIHFWNLPGE